MKKILAGLFTASLVVVSCGGDDGGIDSNDRDALIEMFTADGSSHAINLIAALRI